LSVSCGATDRTKLICIQGGPTNEPPIDILHAEQLDSIGGLDATAVQNSYTARHLGALGSQLRTNGGMHFLSLLRRRSQPGTDGPDRLISHHCLSEGTHTQLFDHTAQLRGDH